MAYCTYVYRDPKTNVLIYVGEGNERRPHSHLRASTNPRLDFLLKKRISEGFNPQPIIIPASSKEDAQEMEELLIGMIGRADLKEGTLFNYTNGGGGMVGFKHSEEWCKNHSEFLKANPVKHWTGKKRSQESIDKQIANKTPWNQTDEIKDRLSKVKTGKRIYLGPNGERKYFIPGQEPLGFTRA